MVIAARASVTALLLICFLIPGLPSYDTARAEPSPGEGDFRDVPTNYQLLKMTIEEAIDEVYDRLPSHEPRKLCVEPQSGAPGNWLVERVLVEKLLVRGYQVIIPDSLAARSQDVCAQAEILRYRIVTLDLDYPSSRRKHLFGPRLVERKVLLHFHFYLSRVSGDVIWTGDARRTAGDWITTSQLPVVEQETVSFVSPRLQVDGWGRFAEPVLLTTVIGGLIYWFYSTQ